MMVFVKPRVQRNSCNKHVIGLKSANGRKQLKGPQGAVSQQHKRRYIGQIFNHASPQHDCCISCHCQQHTNNLAKVGLSWFPAMTWKVEECMGITHEVGRNNLVLSVTKESLQVRMLSSKPFSYLIVRSRFLESSSQVLQHNRCYWGAHWSFWRNWRDTRCVKILLSATITPVVLAKAWLNTGRR